MTNNQFERPNEPISNPCMGVCSLDDRDLCIACRRSGIEIAQWGVFSQAEKRAVLEKIEQRYLQES